MRNVASEQREKANASLRISGFLERRAGLVIAAALVLTLLLIIPLLAMEPDAEASSDPKGQVFGLQDTLDQRFQAVVHGAAYIIEARDGDVLTQPVLWELYQNTQDLLDVDARGLLAPDSLPRQPYLYSSFQTYTHRPFTGLSTIADHVQEVLRHDPSLDVSLETATDQQVKLAVHRLLSSPLTDGLQDTLSEKASSVSREVAGETIDYWTSPGLVFTVLADNDKLGGHSAVRGGLGAGDATLNKEKFNRNVQEVLRGDQRSFELWGVALDQNLEAEDEGRIAGIFIMLTIATVVVVVGLSLRSYWAMALTGAGLGAMMIWLGGISNLVGLKSGLVIDFIVPIAMVALGVDFVVHAVRRYQEEKSIGYAPGPAFRVGLAGVMGALVLAMLSDGVAFLANTSSGIEAVVHFGLAAGIAVGSSFLILGVVAPLALARIDRLRAGRNPPPGRFGRIGRIFGGLGVASMSGNGVLLLVVGITIPGVGLILGSIVAFLLVPAFWLRFRGPAVSDLPTQSPAVRREGSLEAWLSSLVVRLARFRLAVLAVSAGVTAGAVLLALQLEAEFDVKDFFDSKSDFVVGLDKLDEHVGQRRGEQALIYLEGDLASPEALASIQLLIEKLGDNPHIARGVDGTPFIQDPNVIDVLTRVTGTAYAVNRVLEMTGVQVHDQNGDGLPDTREQVSAVMGYAVAHGVPLDNATLVYDGGRVREVLSYQPGGGRDAAALLTLGIPDSREQSTVRAAREGLTEDIAFLADSGAITEFGITGSPFVREGQLAAVTSTLQTSLPIAVVATLALLLLALRSFRYALVTVIPVVLVAAWLYGIMYLVGFNLNFVTATIGAVSIGVGIDYSVHMTMRFREELARSGDRMQALQKAVNGTGMALAVSAVSSILGFAILGFAPMPMFSAFGILTALMVFLALAASIVVLPSLLLLATPDKARNPTA